jgi:hypothetical protein
VDESAAEQAWNLDSNLAKAVLIARAVMLRRQRVYLAMRQGPGKQGAARAFDQADLAYMQATALYHQAGGRNQVYH